MLNLEIFVSTGGPLITEEDDGNFTLVGILSGGGIDCSRLGDPNYNTENKTGRWMKVGAFEKWIQSIIYEETAPSKKHSHMNPVGQILCFLLRKKE